jgi:hypothetical protein
VSRLVGKAMKVLWMLGLPAEAFGPGFLGGMT